MKLTRLLSKTICLFVILLCGSALAADPNPSTPVFYSLESCYGETNTSKSGYPELVSSCPGDPDYRQKVYRFATDFNECTRVYSVSGSGSSDHYVSEQVFDDEWLQISDIWSYDYQDDNGDCSYSYNNGDKSGDEHCYPGDVEEFGSKQHDQYLSPTQSIDTWFSEINQPENEFYCKYDQYYLHTLDDEFTTDDLVAVDPGAYSEWMAGGNEAYANLSDKTDGVQVRDYKADLQKVQYRLKVLAPAGQRFTIPYTVHKVRQDDAYQTNWTAEFKGVGTGGVSYHDLIELLPEVVYVTNEFGCDDAVGIRQWITLSCGGGPTCLDSGSCTVGPGVFGAANSSVSIFAGLGQGNFGEGSAHLILYCEGPASPQITSATNLQVMGDISGLEIIRTNDALLQVLSPQVLADISQVSPTQLQIRFYEVSSVGLDPQTGRYDTNSATLVSVGTIEQVQGSTNHIRLTVEKTETTQVFDYTWNGQDNGWTLESGGGLRKERRTRTESPLVLTRSILDAGNQVIFQEVERYAALTDDGNVLVARETGLGNSSQTNQWVYYNDPQNDGASYGKLQWVIEPSGFWTYYEYDANGMVLKEVSQVGNAPTNAAESLCRVVEHDYTPLNGTSAERRIEKLLGHEIARSYTLDYGRTNRSIQCQTPGAAWNASDNLVTETTYGPDGEVWRTINPDGTIQLTTTETNSTTRIVWTRSGKPNANHTAVVAGVSNVTYTTVSGQVTDRYEYDIQSGLMTRWEQNTYDSLGRLTQTLNQLSSKHEDFTYSCCGVETRTGPDGAVTHYLYDALNRQNATEVNDVINGQHLDAVGNALAQYRVPDGGSEVTLRTLGYDTAGRLVAETNALDGVTTYSEAFNASGETVRTTIYPDGGTRIETYFKDGSLKSVTGTAVFPVYYEYGVEQEPSVWRAYTKEIKGSPTGTEWTKTYTDMLGRAYKTVYADASGTPASVSYYNNLGQLEKQVDPDGVTTLYAYNAAGELETTAVDMDASGTLTTADRVTHTESDVVQLGGADLWPNATIRRTLTWQTNDTGSGVLVAERWASVDGLRSASIAFGQTNQTLTEYPGSGQRRETQTAPDGTTTVSLYEDGRLASVTHYAADGYTVLGGATYGYDSHGRIQQATDARNGATTLLYNLADLVATNTLPDPDGAGPGQPQETITHYNTSLRAWRIVQPDNTSVTNEYFTTGLLKKTRGSRTYPVEYTYDSAGRLQTMKTWTNAATATGAAVTTWVYDAYRGWLAKKVYQGETDNTADYEYLPSGRLWKRHWERGISTTYGYNGAGDLASADYSDATPDAAYGYDRRGRQTTVTNGGALWLTRAHNDAGQLLGESYSGGPLSGLSVTNQYDALLRRTNVALVSGTTRLTTNGWSYEAGGGRLQTASLPGHSVTYSYVANSPLEAQLVFKQGTTTRMTTTKSYDLLNRLTNSVSSAGGSNVVSFAYAYNAANQRTSVTNVDGSYWVYTYDALGQVTSGKKRWDDGTLVAGQQFEYGFDDIGNRDWTKAGQEAGSGQSHRADYANNLRNQITQREVAGFLGVSGVADEDATVTVNLTATARKGEYWWGEAPAANASGPVWLAVTNIAVLDQGASPDRVATNIGHAFVPGTPEVFGYDADGNLTSEGRWTYTWDAENRATSFTRVSGSPSGAKVKVECQYDDRGRRTRKVVSAWNGSAYVAQSTNNFVYDGWNLVAILDDTNGLDRTFTWGSDASGTLQGAGGVGGLISMTVHQGTNAGTYFYCFDGNGNVVALVNASNGAIAGQWEYDPFLGVIRATGPLAFANPFLGSTKFYDWETGLYYYGYRYYDPSTGQWPNRDPLEEWGGVNLYACVINNPISYVDTDGMQLFPPVLIEAPPVLIPRPILEPIVRPGPGIPPEWLPIPAPRPVPTPPGGGTMPPLYPPVPIIPPQPGNPNPTPDPSPNPSPQPQPNPGQNAPPQTVTQDCGEWLCRLGKNWESTAQLASAAEKAKGFGYGYGVSVLLFSKPPPTASCAPKIMLEAAFQVRKTGAKANHYTVIFAEPLTDPEADRFNRTIGRTPPPPPPPPPRRPYPPGTIIAVVPAY